MRFLFRLVIQKEFITYQQRNQRAAKQFRERWNVLDDIEKLKLKIQKTWNDKLTVESQLSSYEENLLP